MYTSTSSIFVLQNQFLISWTLFVISSHTTCVLVTPSLQIQFTLDYYPATKFRCIQSYDTLPLQNSTCRLIVNIPNKRFLILKSASVSISLIWIFTAVFSRMATEAV